MKFLNKVRTKEINLQRYSVCASNAVIEKLPISYSKYYVVTAFLTQTKNKYDLKEQCPVDIKAT